MTPDRSDADGSEVLGEEAVRRLLTRASELEAARSTHLSVSELREIAREAGIAPSAFEDALAELRNRSLHAHADASRPKRGMGSRLRSAALGTLATLGTLGAAYVLMRMFVP